VIRWLPDHLTADGVAVLHTKLPDDLAPIEAGVVAASLEAIVVQARDIGKGKFAVGVVERGGRGFRCLEADPADTIWEWHFAWEVIAALSNSRPHPREFPLCARLRFVPWLRPDWRGRATSDGWRIDTMRLLGVELAGVEAMVSWHLGAGSSIADAVARAASIASIPEEEAMEQALTLVRRLVGSGLAELVESNGRA
jgi:hypothetical protein